MAVKKKEKRSQSRQSEKPGSRKTAHSALPMRSFSSKPGEGVDKAKTDKSKTSNSQKMKSGEEQKEAKQKDGNLGNFPIKHSVIEAGQFLGEVQAEARKISWPERSQVIRETLSVLFLVALITIFVWLFDLTVARFVFAPLEHWGHLYGIGGTK